MQKKEPMTSAGAQALKAELGDLKGVRRPAVIKAIATAREHGDLKENAEYHAAREQQSFIEGRIQDIEGKIGNAVVVDVHKLKQDGRVVFGTTVELLDLNSNEKVIYQIVGTDEADIKENKISVGSPIARALISKEEGDDDVLVKTPGGEREFEILSVKYL